MAVVISQDVQQPESAVTVQDNKETLVVTGFPLSLTSDHAKAVVRGWVDFTTAADATGAKLAIYEGADASGRLVSARVFDTGQLAPGNTVHFEHEAVDVLQNAGGAQYCMTVTQTAATTDGTVIGGMLQTTLLSG